MRAFASSVAFCVAMACPTTIRAQQQDNVLIILADDLGVDAVGVYGEGAAPPPTPNLDALAANGVLFRNAYTNPFCSPTRACIQTGRYSMRTGVGKPIPTLPALPPENVLSLAETTLPEMLDAAGSGYSHAAIGKWHLGDDTNGGDLGPNLAGWSHFAGLIQGWSDYYSWPRCVNGVTATSTTYATTQIVDDALAWLQTAPEPWVCYLAFTAPHDPYHAPPAQLHTQNLPGVNPNEQSVPFFKAMVEAMDTEIGRLFTTMGPTLLGRTNVVFLGDNGTPPEVSEPPFSSTRAKGSVYEGGINVPLIVSGPIANGAPREEPALVSAVDLFPTILELCGVEPSVPYVKQDGVSFVPHLQSSGLPPTRKFAFAEKFDDNSLTTTGSVGIRNAKYKLVRAFQAGPPVDELYDLLADPFEQNDLLSQTLTPPQATNYNELKAELSTIRNTSGSFATFGSISCAGSNGPPSISASGSPDIGTTYAVSLQSAAASTQAFLFLGASRTRWHNLELPMSFRSFYGSATSGQHATSSVESDGDRPTRAGSSGCFLWASGETVLPTVTSALGSVTVDVSIPNDPTLVSGETYLTWVVSDPAAPNPHKLTTSNGLIVTAGL